MLIDVNRCQQMICQLEYNINNINWQMYNSKILPAQLQPQYQQGRHQLDNSHSNNPLSNDYSDNINNNYTHNDVNRQQQNNNSCINDSNMVGNMSSNSVVRFGTIRKNITRISSKTQLTHTNYISSTNQQYKATNANDSNRDNINSNIDTNVQYISDGNNRTNTNRIINSNKFGLIVNMQPSASYSIANDTQHQPIINSKQQPIKNNRQKVQGNNHNTNDHKHSKQFIRSNQIYNNNNNNQQGKDTIVADSHTQINTIYQTNGNQHRLLTRPTYHKVTQKQQPQFKTRKVNHQPQAIQQSSSIQTPYNTGNVKAKTNNTTHNHNNNNTNNNTNSNTNTNNRISSSKIPISSEGDKGQQQKQSLNKYFNNDQSGYCSEQSQQISLPAPSNMMRPKRMQKQQYQKLDESAQDLFIQLNSLQTLNHQHIYGYIDDAQQHTNENNSNNHRYRDQSYNSYGHSLSRNNTLHNKHNVGLAGIPQTLEFNPQNQKITFSDSKQTQNINQNVVQNLSLICEDFDIRIPSQVPSLTNTPQQLIQIAKANFIQLGCQIDDLTVISVKKYKNCVHFSISKEHNILWYYEYVKFYYGGWKIAHNGEGQKYGQGIEYIEQKYKFKGYFAQGKRTGYGILIKFDGSAYAGQWQNGMKHGQGKQIDNQGILYEGEWKQGKKSGYGKLFNIKNNNKFLFQGVFAKGLKNGYGKQYFENGDTYDGNYANHKFEGKGIYCWKSGANYNGQFKHGKRNGYGIWKSSGKKYDTYQGYYTDDKKHGKGIYRWTNGAVYDGWFKEDLKHGEGTITYENGKQARLIWIKGVVQKKIDSQHQNQKIPNNTQYKPNKYEQFPLTQRRFKEQIPTNQHSRINQRNNAKTMTKLGGRSASEKILSARTTSYNHPNFPKGIVYHGQSMKKLSTNIQQNKKQSKLSNDQDRLDSLPSKYWNKNYIINQQRVKQQNKRPSLPKERPYTGIQTSSNIVMDHY